MIFRPLGRTGLNISSIALGTVALGVTYGIEVPGEFGRPDERDAIQLLQHAADEGINLFDTAPAYGESERLLGLALGHRDGCIIATKLSVPRDADGRCLTGTPLQQVIAASLENSLRALQRAMLDIVQIHNATEDVIAQGEITDVLLETRRRGKLRFLGASVYTEAEAIAVIKTGSFDVLQVPYNVLDQRMARRVFPMAERAGVSVIVRSSFLKGALTPKGQWLPAELAELKQAVERAKDGLVGSWHDLPKIALRFCLSSPYVASVLVGARTMKELKEALVAAEAGPLSEQQLTLASALALTDERLLNPSYWPVEHGAGDTEVIVHSPLDTYN